MFRILKPNHFQHAKRLVNPDPKWLRATFYKTSVPENKKYNDFKRFQEQRSLFHTTKPCNIPPMLALILRPILRVGAFLAGRQIKKWWSKRTEKEKDEYRLWFRENTITFVGSLAFMIFLSIVYYLSHLETEPITKRRRFIMFNKNQKDNLYKVLFEMHLQEHKAHIVPGSHPVYLRLKKVVENIIDKNSDLITSEYKPWTLTVVDLPLRNAYVLPGRNIFVFTGVLQVAENDDQLSFILTHEMAHALLEHSMEQISREFFVDLFLIIPTICVWAIFPDVKALLIHLLGLSIVNVFSDLPHARKLENEADDIGIILSAKACVDVREIVVFWDLMHKITDSGDEIKEIPWLSTHPTHADRSKRINKKIPTALKMREEAGCPPLDSRDPRDDYSKRSKAENEEMLRRRGIVINLS
ncbi:metalloendopeptidase OMA1, mitochondrial-like [Prorops nasuta]|uniref:metalloendopeptidase OMA1, mitochondrial-like n=1 Tax=Prorops nasuta TaxID=863751 RepID=UPI0034D00FB9